ncbi:hypothetical protein BZA77DRAFT_342479 [Pyronema omphalodes]|nr:hypothetical protein BZA77DRAFT_342479 [Pyronema omphalodes]
MFPPSITICLVQFTLSVFSLLAAYHTPPAFYFLHVLLQVFCFLLHFAYPPSSIAILTYVPVAASFFQILRFSDFLLLSRSYEEFQQPGKPKYAELGSFDRLKWALNTTFSTRGIGWSWEIPYIPSSTSRITRRSLFRSISMAYIISISPNSREGRNKAKRNAVFEKYNTDVGCWFIGCIWNFGAVSGGLFWGRGWHQSARRVHGKWLAHDILGFRKGSAASALTQAVVVFTLCGAAHWVGCFAADRSRWWINTEVFFMVQPVGIAIERAVAQVGKRAGIRPDAWWVKVVGFTWFAVWIGITLPLYIEDCAQVGMLKEMWRLSLVQGISAGKWFVG